MARGVQADTVEEYGATVHFAPDDAPLSEVTLRAVLAVRLRELGSSFDEAGRPS